jgi:prepilin-type processing-associated H-X9-DG protein
MKQLLITTHASASPRQKLDVGIHSEVRTLRNAVRRESVFKPSASPLMIIWRKASSVLSSGDSHRNNSRRRHSFASRNGLTVLELLVISAVLSGLISLVVPAIQASREAARNIQCEDHLRQIGLALHRHCDSDEKLPPGWHINPDAATAFGWATFLLPDLEESNLSDDGDPFKVSAKTRTRATPQIFVCPSDVAEPQFDVFRETDIRAEQGESTERLGTLPQANYLGVFGYSDPDLLPDGIGEGVFIQNRPIHLAEITRGVSHVIFVGERSARKLPSSWIGTFLAGENAQSRIVGMADLGPSRDDSDESEFDSRHPTHSNFLWGDGRVQSVTDDVDSLVYRSSAARE